MHLGSAWLAKLNEAENGPPAVPITSIWSRHDSMVIPQGSADLGGADNIPLVGVGHNALLIDPRVIEIVRERLRQAATFTAIS